MKNSNYGNILNRAKKFVVGLTLSWTDENPEISTNKPAFTLTISHKNPVNRLFAKEAFQRYADYIQTGAQFQWRITTVTVFHYPNGIEQREESIFNAFCYFHELDDAILPELALDRRAGKHFKHVEFFVECVSLHPYKECLAA